MLKPSAEYLRHVSQLTPSNCRAAASLIPDQSVSRLLAAADQLFPQSKPQIHFIPSYQTHCSIVFQNWRINHEPLFKTDSCSANDGNSSTFIKQRRLLPYPEPD